jgi:UDP-N-acetyl-D-mannosaminuronic acid dehydrogenase
MNLKLISVIGLGYIGLPTAAIIASKGFKVRGVDIQENVVETINKGKIHIVEPGLQEIVKEVVLRKNLFTSTKVTKSDVFILAVPTPFKDNNSKIPEPDISYIESVVNDIGPVLEKGNLIILESTSPVGTTKKIIEWLKVIRPELNLDSENPDINVAYCPERVLPGNVLEELINNNRVIGGITKACSKKAISLYKLFVDGDLIETNSKTAEMTKLTENAYRDVQIAFANELSFIADDIDINVWELINLANLHPRVNILNPGCGVGGHCIAVDPWFIAYKSPNDSQLIQTARSTNNMKPVWVVNKVKTLLEEYLEYNSANESKVKIGCFGLSFKPDIDDLRESPALEITRELASSLKCKVFAIEPNIKKLDTHEDFALITDLDLITSFDISVILVSHKEFYEIEFTDCKFIVDAVGLLK